MMPDIDGYLPVGYARGGQVQRPPRSRSGKSSRGSKGARPHAPKQPKPPKPPSDDQPSPDDQPDQASPADQIGQPGMIDPSMAQAPDMAAPSDQSPDSAPVPDMPTGYQDGGPVSDDPYAFGRQPPNEDDDPNKYPPGTRWQSYRALNQDQAREYAGYENDPRWQGSPYSVNIEDRRPAHFIVPSASPAPAPAPVTADPLPPSPVRPGANLAREAGLYDIAAAARRLRHHGNVGYQAGGTVQPANMDHKAAILAGLRKRYDAHIAIAQGALHHGDLDAAMHMAQRAHDQVPDGKNLSFGRTPDGNVGATVSTPDGRAESTHKLSPQQFHHYLVGPATSFDHVIENGVGKNLSIASGQRPAPAAEHPDDPIHQVRQVLHHTRRMFGLHQIGQPVVRRGYQGGGPVERIGYQDGGDVYSPSDEELAQQYNAQAPAQPTPTGVAPTDVELANPPPDQPQLDPAKRAWNWLKDKIASYYNGANAAPSDHVDGQIAAAQAADPNAGRASAVQQAVVNPSAAAAAPAPAPVTTGYAGVPARAPTDSGYISDTTRLLPSDPYVESRGAAGPPTPEGRAPAFTPTMVGQLGRDFPAGVQSNEVPDRYGPSSPAYTGYLTNAQIAQGMTAATPQRPQPPGPAVPIAGGGVGTIPFAGSEEDRRIQAGLPAFAPGGTREQQALQIAQQRQLTPEQQQNMDVRQRGIEAYRQLQAEAQPRIVAPAVSEERLRPQLEWATLDKSSSEKRSKDSSSEASSISKTGRSQRSASSDEGMKKSAEESARTPHFGPGMPAQYIPDKAGEAAEAQRLAAARQRLADFGPAPWDRPGWHTDLQRPLPPDIFTPKNASPPMNAVQQKAAEALSKSNSETQRQFAETYREKLKGGIKTLPEEDAAYQMLVQRYTGGQAAIPAAPAASVRGVASALNTAASASSGQPIRVNSLAEAARLSRGIQFIDPNGNLRIVP